MGGWPKVTSGDREVGGDGELFAVLGPKEGAVIANSKSNLAARCRWYAVPDEAN
jgi:hypothetical protein